MNKYESEMVDRALGAAAKGSFGVAVLDRSKIKSDMRDWQAATLIFAMGVTGLCYDLFDKIDHDAVNHFYQKGA